MDHRRSSISSCQNVASIVGQRSHPNPHEKGRSSHTRAEHWMNSRESSENQIGTHTKEKKEEKWQKIEGNPIGFWFFLSLQVIVVVAVVFHPAAVLQRMSVPQFLLVAAPPAAMASSPIHFPTSPEFPSAILIRDLARHQKSPHGSLQQTRARL